MSQTFLISFQSSANFFETGNIVAEAHTTSRALLQELMAVHCASICISGLVVAHCCCRRTCLIFIEWSSWGRFSSELILMSFSSVVHALNPHVFSTIALKCYDRLVQTFLLSECNLDFVPSPAFYCISYHLFKKRIYLDIESENHRIICHRIIYFRILHKVTAWLHADISMKN